MNPTPVELDKVINYMSELDEDIQQLTIAEFIDFCRDALRLARTSLASIKMAEKSSDGGDYFNRQISVKGLLLDMSDPVLKLSEEDLESFRSEL